MAAVDRVAAREGDTLDLLLWRERALGPETLPAVLALNPGLADLGARLALGATVLVPPSVAAAAAIRPTVNLWD